MQLAGDVELDGVLFDYLCDEGIRLADAGSAESWRNVAFGPHNAGGRGSLFGPMTVDANAYYHNRGDMRSEFGLTKTAVKSMEEYLKRHDRYRLSVRPETTEVRDVGGLKKPMPVLFDGPVKVTIRCEEPGARVYYTTDGSEPTQSSSEYRGPFELSRTCRLRARAFKEGLPPSLAFSTAFVFKGD
jgi:hypothetical protein